MLYDQAKVHVEAGRGGNGVVSFRREAHVPRGGPDGGDGGRGGDVVLVCDPSRRDLATLRRNPHLKAGRGGHGQGKQRHGPRGEDRVVPVPPGTLVEGLDAERYDLTQPGQRVVVAGGGAGGHGNKRFASSTRQAPRFAEKGLQGQSGWIELRLKLLADAGLVGLPNAGKSSLLRRLTRAAPKVADYPFTTIEPVLGTLESDERQLVVADIPGLIEGAAAGAGLGHEFLAHVERCRVLVHLVAAGPGEDPEAAYATVRGELAQYGAGLESLPELLIVSKRDLLTDVEVAEVLERMNGMRREGSPRALAVSSATGESIAELSAALFAAVPEGDRAAAPEAGARFEADHVTYRPADQGFEVVRNDDGGFTVAGRGVEMLFARHDVANPEALAYLEQRLREIGVIAALEKAGFEPGDEVRVGEEAFELHP
jgi:GTPase